MTKSDSDAADAAVSAMIDRAENRGQFDIVSFVSRHPFTRASYFTRNKKTASIFAWKICGGLIVYDSCAPKDMQWIACSCERYEHIDRDAAVNSINAGHMMIPPWRD